MNQTIRDHTPPRIPRAILKWYCKPELLEDIEGDIHEDFNKRYTRSGKRSARFFYTLDVIRFFKPFAIRKISKTQIDNGMFRMNTKIAFRSLAKNKLYSFINVTGLAIGIAACLIIAHYVQFQLSFDRFHENGNRIYRVNTSNYQNGEYINTGMYCGSALGPALHQDVPEIEKYSRIHPYYNGAVINRVVDTLDSTPFHEEDVLFVEPAFLEMFSFKVLQGDPQTALNDPNSVIITKSVIPKYFGNNQESVIGETLKITGGWASGNFKVTAVLDDVPANSHLKFDFLLPISKALEDNQYQSESSKWGWTNFFMYAQLTPQASWETVNSKISDLMHKYTPEQLEASSSQQVLSLQSILDIHLKSPVDDGDGEFLESGNINSVYFMIVIATFILIIAWINFINLSTAKATERGLEVGIKKSLGALRKQLIAQFLTESFWVNIMAIALAIVLTYLFMPILANTIGEPLEVNLKSPAIMLGLVALILIGPLLSGLYPAFVLSSFKTTNALKGSHQLNHKGHFPLRKVLVVFQFVISTLLIAGTFVVSRQLGYMQNRDTGIDMDKILVIKGPRIDVSLAKFEQFKEKMTTFPMVEKFASSRSVPGAGYNLGTETRKIGAEQSKNRRIDVTWIDKNFTDTYGMELIAGRDFSQAIRGAENGALISEAALEAYELGSAEEALGHKLTYGSDTLPIRGVVKDHNWQSLHKAYTPSAFLYTYATASYFSLRVNTQNVKSTIETIEKEFQSAFPGNPLEYYFLDDFFNRQYQDDREFKSIFNAFAIFAIFAACLGLFGLASFTVVQKAKEIGIRKVLGASRSHITLLFSKRYMLLIVIANAVAVPIAFFGIKSWLENFAFSINISLDLFIFPILLLALIAAFTISIQTLKASMASPVKNLRSE